MLPEFGAVTLVPGGDRPGVVDKGDGEVELGVDGVVVDGDGEIAGVDGVLPGLAGEVAGVDGMLPGLAVEGDGEVAVGDGALL